MLDEPLVSVVTPVYNGEDFLEECIESVLGQTYRNLEYIIVNNCSTDRTLEIAKKYAQKDDRIRVHDNQEFVPVIANHNIAFRLISPAARYCKVVSADDFIFPDCLRQMVRVAEMHPSVGLVGCYQLSKESVRWQGFDYPKTVFSGREICRRIFLHGARHFGFGSPTSLLYRADLVRASESFYPNSSPHADTSACFQSLHQSDYGFVYQVLSYERIHEQTQTAKSKKINRYSSANLSDLIQYGPLYLTPDEYSHLLKRQVNGYYRYLAVNVLKFNDNEFRTYHSSRLKELGYPLTFSRLLKAGLVAVFREMLNPEQAVRKFLKRVAPGANGSASEQECVYTPSEDR